MELNKYIKFILAQLLPMILIITGGLFYMALIAYGIIGLFNSSANPGSAPMMLLVSFLIGTVIMVVSGIAAGILRGKFK